MNDIFRGRMRKILITALVLLPVLTFAVTCIADNSLARNYFTRGGLSTMFLLDGLHHSKKVDRGMFSSARDAVRTSKGDVYVKVFGRLKSQSSDQVHVIELPVARRKREVKSFYDKNRHVSGMHTLRLKKKFIHAGEDFWEKSSSRETTPLPVVRIEDKNDVTPGNRLYFLPHATFVYGEETPIFGEQGYWIRFNASPAKYTKGWTRVFVPVTYVVDVITSPIQIPVLWWINKNT